MHVLAQEIHKNEPIRALPDNPSQRQADPAPKQTKAPLRSSIWEGATPESRGERTVLWEVLFLVPDVEIHKARPYITTFTKVDTMHIKDLTWKCIVIKPWEEHIHH